jgi:hypothetical protein
MLLPALQLDSLAAMARGGVFPLYADGQTGSAFLVDSSGIVLTSAEFARGNLEPRIQLDSNRVVVGRVISVDAARNIAALRIPIQYCGRCAVLQLASDSASRVNSGDSIVVPTAVTRGSAVVHSRGTVTQTDGGVIRTSLQWSDRAASGAPVLASGRGVVALAFRRGRQTNLVSAENLARLRSEAYRKRSSVLPNDTLVPFWPLAPVSRTELNTAKSRNVNDLTPYKIVQEPFELLVMTPHVMSWRADQIRQKVEGMQLMALGDSQPRRNVDAIQLWREWNSYLSDRRAVVVLQATPALAGYDKLRPNAVVNLRAGDVADLRLLRGDTLVRPIEAARIPAVVNAESYRRENQPLYQSGVAVYHPREFARRGGRFPALVVEVVDGRSNRSTRIALSEAALTAIERDLRSFQR